MATNQEALISALQTALGAGYEDYSLEGLWHAYWDGEGIAAGPFNQRLLAWINSYEGTSLEDLPRLMQLYADNLSFYNWSSITAFTLGGGGTPPPEPEQDTGDQTSVGVSSDNAAFASDVTAGNMIIVAVSIKSGTEQTDEITDSLGNLYQLLVREIDTDVTVELWGAYNITGGSATVTLTYSAALNASWAAVEIANARGNNPVDFTSMATNVGAGGSSDPATVTGGTPAAANNLWVAALALGGGGTNAAIVTPTGWTEFNLSNNYTDAMAGEADTITDVDGVAQTASWANDTTTANYAAAILAIKNADVAPSTVDGEGEVAAIVSERDFAGVFYNPQDPTSLYIDRNGNSETSDYGDLVGFILDKSRMGGLTAASFIASQPELQTNGGFDTDTDWTKGLGWTISGGTANAVATSNQITQSVLSATPTWTLIEFDITSYTSGSVTAYAGGTSGVAYSAVGSYKNFILPTGANQLAGLTGTSFTGSVDNVVVKHVPGYHAIATAADDEAILDIDLESGKNKLLHTSLTRYKIDEFDSTEFPTIDIFQGISDLDDTTYIYYSATTSRWLGILHNGSTATSFSTADPYDTEVDGSPVGPFANRDAAHTALSGLDAHVLAFRDFTPTAFTYLEFGGGHYGGYTADSGYGMRGLIIRDVSTKTLKNPQLSTIEAYLAADVDNTNMHVSSLDAEVLYSASVNPRLTKISTDVVHTQEVDPRLTKISVDVIYTPV